MVGEVSSQPDWKTPYLEYILNDKLPESKNEARSLMYKVRNYCVKDSKLYRRSLVKPLLHCLRPEETHPAIIEVHIGIYGEHMGGKSLVLKILRQGFFWPTLRKECEEFIKKCVPCQLHENVSHRPTTAINPILVPCPFFQWGIDIVEPSLNQETKCSTLWSPSTM